jgi:hypothetical protein
MSFKLPRSIPQLLMVSVYLGMLGALSACATPLLRSSPCLPAPLQISPTTPAPGSQATISSGPFPCKASYPSGKTYHLIFGRQDQVGPTDLGDRPVNHDGSFRATITIPEAALPGQAYIVVQGSMFDQCNDGGASCASYVVGLTVVTTPST